MRIDYDLVPFSDDIREAYLALLPEQEQAVARGKLEWKFRDAPAGPGLIATARDEAGQVVGVNAFMAGLFAVGGRRVRGYQSMDTIVSPAARGQGVFAKLINCFYEKADAALLYGFPNLNSSPGFFGRLGWTSFGSVPMLVRPLRTGYFARKLAGFLPDLPLPLFGSRCSNVERLTKFDDDVTEAWQRFSTDVKCTIERDRDFLNWRVADHPTEDYDVLRAPDGSFTVSAVSNKHGGRIGYLMEAIGSGKSLASLITTSLHELRGKGAELAFAWCLPWSPNYSAYRRAGFYPFPTKLRPIVINFGARALTDPDNAIITGRSWYVSYLDSDTV